eukprot:CAMPEP_0113630480 /NCGR_PEP_ID=MMETSP0017_2-20120614/15835_1 /TAXON_ID=2856 /ORGANISM="Cylindrotheca closterium" /LENGTH=112 /DNA_ID=CAMNT_0000540943 /DNA_START=204 /DNA_END=542 /DNA_ORIENTATION=- /assembly_acc=CAM_ASM_000147
MNNSPFDRAVQFCESLFRGLPQAGAAKHHHDHDDAGSVHTSSSSSSYWEDSFHSLRKSLAAPLLAVPPRPAKREPPTCQHTGDGRCVSNISSGKKVLMFDEKTFQFKLTDPL